MIYLKLFESFENRLTLEYLQENFPIQSDEFFLSNFGKEKFFIMIDDKPLRYSHDTGFNEVKNVLVRILSQKGLISDVRSDTQLIKQYLRSAIDKKHFIWIHGLPGSGKTHLANEKINQNPEKNYQLLDDIASIDEVEKHLEKGNNIILSSPYFENYFRIGLYKKLQDLLRSYPNYEKIHLWFENNLQACIANLKKRSEHKTKSELIIPELQYFSKNYKIPPGAKIIPVYQP